MLVLDSSGNGPLDNFFVSPLPVQTIRIRFVNSGHS